MITHSKDVAARLIAHYPYHSARLFSLQRGKSYTLGHSPRCEVPLEDERVAEQHARLKWSENGWQLVNLDKTLGTGVRGRKINSITLHGNTWISLGGLLVELQEADVDDTALA